VIAGQAPFKPYHAATRPAPAIDLSGGFDAYYEELYAREHRLCRELARKARKLEREVGPVSLDCGSSDVGALRTLMAWKSEQYQRTGCVDRFEQPWVPRLVEALLAAQGAEFGGLLSVMSADGQPIAIQFGLRAGRLLVGWFTGYDPRYGKYSPGLIHLLRMTDTLCAMGVDTIHMGKGALRYCRPLKNDGIMVGDGVVTTKGVIGVAQHSYTAMGRRALAMVRRSPWLRDGLNQAFRRIGLSSRLDGRL
jgi:CelD/BcsL family acetyltransferase involved in cellulose biosynthesis